MMNRMRLIIMKFVRLERLMSDYQLDCEAHKLMCDDD